MKQILDKETQNPTLLHYCLIMLEYKHRRIPGDYCQVLAGLPACQVSTADVSQVRRIITGENSVKIGKDVDVIVLRDQLLSIYPAKKFSIKIKTNINFKPPALGQL